MKANEIIREAVKSAGPSLSFADAKEFVADLDTGRGRISAVAARNPWLRQASQEAARREMGQRIVVFRAISAVGDLRPDAVASTTLNPKVAVNILIDAPGMIFHGGNSVVLHPTLLRYEISPENVVMWVPAALEAVKAAVGKRLNHGIEDRYGERRSIQSVLNSHAELDEQEIVADLSGLTPEALALTPDSSGSVKLWAALMWLKGELGGWMSDRPPEEQAAYEAEFREFFGAR